MQIQVNSSMSVTANVELSKFLEANINNALQRFGDRITGVEVHRSDVNGERVGGADKRCLMEIRPSGLDSVDVTDEAATIELAVNGASHKMQRLLISIIGRLGERA